MTEEISVAILDHNLNGMPLFLAKLTQRGQDINHVIDVLSLYKECVGLTPSKSLMKLPHSTIKRMNYITVAIVGLSTKAVSQLRTHAKRLTFISTSTQYSSFEGRKDNYVMPDGLTEEQKTYMQEAYDNIHNAYSKLIADAVDKDKAGYLLPQGLKKALIISGNLDDWEYVMQTRLCHRNTEEVQHICKEIVRKINTLCGKRFTLNMVPSCVNGNCKEDKFCCGHKFTKEEFYE